MLLMAGPPSLSLAGSLGQTPLHPVALSMFCASPFQLLRSIMLCCILFYSRLSYSIPLVSVMFYSTLTLFYCTRLASTAFFSIVLYSLLFYSLWLYSSRCWFCGYPVLLGYISRFIIFYHISFCCICCCIMLCYFVFVDVQIALERSIMVMMFICQISTLSHMAVSKNDGPLICTQMLKCLTEGGQNRTPCLWKLLHVVVSHRRQPAAAAPSD